MALVVGAGPTGLVLAAELARHGIPVRLIEKRAGIDPRSRALAIQPRTMEIFENMGIAGEFMAEARELTAFTPYGEGRKIGRVEWKNEETAYKPMILEQARTEEILREYLEELGVRVESKTELLSFQQLPQGVATELRFSSGLKDALLAKWVFGCDGAHSVVRRGLKLDFAGDRYPEDFILADLKIDWDLADEEAFVFLKEGKVMVALPLPGKDRFRLIASRDPARSAPGDTAPDPDLDEFQELVRTRIPVKARLKKPEWLAAFRLHHRITEDVRIGRVFLAGDAAHIHSPAGGQGMNTGIQDAFNLAWKIALVETGKARPDLLDTYRDERLPVMRETVRLTDRMFRAALSDGFWAKVARRFLAPIFLPRGAVRTRILSRIGQISIRYPSGRYVRDATPIAQRRRGPRPGMRAPDAPVFDIHRGRELKLFDVFQDTRPVLLYFAGEETDLHLKAIRELRLKYSSFIELYLLLPGDSEPALQEPEDLVLNDPDDRVFRAYGVSGAGLFLIRPDGHIGFRSLPAQREKFEAYLDDLFILRHRSRGVTDLV